MTEHSNAMQSAAVMITMQGSAFLSGQRLQAPCSHQPTTKVVVRPVTCMAQRLKGRVISTAMDKTAVVEIVKLEKHRIYEKLMRKTAKYFAHDPDNAAQIGDEVQLVAIRPLSKMKRFEISQTIAESEFQT